MKFVKTSSIFEWSDPDIILCSKGLVSKHIIKDTIYEFSNFGMDQLNEEYQILGLALAISEVYSRNIFFNNNRIVITNNYGDNGLEIRIIGLTLEYYKPIKLKFSFNDNSQICFLYLIIIYSAIHCFISNFAVSAKNRVYALLTIIIMYSVSVVLS